eukprot:TRINITY_DN5314_c0_g1_i1.p1 TRINITY_DN5314_c0_g1~~TRINITY_DN5314_c0_g1_i1.p1  ORF type:complete len:331 (+),score=10.62 TRINITY_DN5314_c0_g1_i1:82-1074(+)
MMTSINSPNLFVMVLLLSLTGQGSCQLCLMTRVMVLSPDISCRVVEWTEYHLKLGVDHIFIHDDCSVNLNWIAMSRNIHSQRVTVIPTSRDCSSPPNENLLFSAMFRNYIEHLCTWAGLIDIDEYITTQDSTRSLKEILELQLDKGGYIKMPWWIIGSHGIEKKFPGLWIETFRVGCLHSNLHKTIAYVKNIKDWGNSHYPVFKNRVTHNIVSQLSYREEDVLRINESVAIPATGVYVKHYLYLSWEEYQAQRAAYNMTSMGTHNIWGGDNKRSHWSVGAKDHISTILDVEFTLDMAIKVRRALSKYHQDALLGCHKIWGLQPSFLVRKV